MMPHIGRFWLSFLAVLSGALLYATTGAAGPGALDQKNKTSTAYVSSTDPTCEAKTPCFSTIQKAVDAATAGSRIEVQPGTYGERVLVAGKNASGSGEADRIVIERAPESTPGSVVLAVPDDQPCSRAYGIQVVKSNYITVRGLVIDAIGTGIIVSEAHGVNVERNRIFAAEKCASGISVGKRTVDTFIGNNLIYGTGRNGIFLRGKAGPTYIVNNSLYGTRWNGVRVAGRHVAWMVNNLVLSNGATEDRKSKSYGVRRSGGAKTADRLFLRNNVVCGNRRAEFRGNMFDAADVGNLTPTGVEAATVAEVPGCELLENLLEDLAGQDGELGTADDDFTLKAGAAAIDGGADPRTLGMPVPDEVLEADYLGADRRPLNGAGATALFDVGAFEFGDVTPDSTPPPPCPPSGTPVSLGIGNYRWSAIDVMIPGRGVPLRLRRTYNSVDTRSGWFGRGWSTECGIQVVPVLETDMTGVIVRLADGQRLWFADTGLGTFDGPANSFVALDREMDGTLRVTTRSDQIIHFNAAGSLLSWVDREGNGISITYDASGLVPVEMKDDADRTLTFVLGDDGKIAQVVDHTGRVFGYEYEGDWLVASVDPAGGRTTYEYDSAGRLIRIADPRGNVMEEVAYDSSGRVASFREQEEIFSMTYLPSGEVRKTDLDGNVWTYWVDSVGAITKEVDPLGFTILRTVQGGNVTSVTDKRGNTMLLEYDERGNRTRLTDAEGNSMAWAYVPGTDLVAALTNGNGEVTNFQYDSNLRLIKQVSADSSEINYGYDSDGNLTVIVDPNGNTWTYGYNVAGDQISASSPEGNTYHKAYDSLGNLTQMSQVGGGAWSMEYDDRNLLVKIADPDGNIVTHSYDANGNRLSTLDASGSSSSHVYDAYNRLLSTTDGAGRTFSWGYDRLGSVVRGTNGNGNSIQYEIDVNRNLTAHVDEMGQRISAAVDPYGAADSVTDAIGNAYLETHDIRGNALTLTDPLGNQTQWEYDAAGQMIEKSYANGNVVTYERDRLGAIVQIASPGSETVKIERDLGGRITRIANTATDFSYAYDGDGNLLSVTNGISGESIQYTYDTRGLVETMTDSGGTPTSYVYDSFGRLTQILRKGTVETSYVYDEAGRRIQQVSPNGIVTTYAYDGGGQIRLIEATDSGGTKVFRQEMTRDGNSNVSVMEQTSYRAYGYSDTTFIRYEYDAANRITREERRDASDTIVTSLSTFDYDAKGNRSRAIVDGVETIYSYDSANRLLSEANEVGVIDYTYDANGNLLTETMNGDTVAYVYDYENRLIAMAGPTFDVTYTLTPDGKRIAKTVNGTTTTFTYDGMNVIEEKSGASVVQYVYGRVIDEILAKEDAGSRYYYHRGNVDSVFGLSDEMGSIVNSYDYSAFGEPLFTEESTFNPLRFAARRLDPESSHYYFRERMFSSRTGRFHSVDPARADAARSIRFGRAPVIEGSVEYSPLFEARLDVNVSGMDLGGYVYTGNNPSNAIDPTGEILIWNPFSASATSGCAGSGCLLSGCGSSGCLGSACGGSGCLGSGCGASGCGGSACLVSGCLGSVCAASGCAASGCAGSICGGSLCLVSGCTWSGCGGSACVGSACGLSACVGSVCGVSACVGSACVDSVCTGSVCFGTSCMVSVCGQSSGCAGSGCGGTSGCAGPGNCPAPPKPCK